MAILLSVIFIIVSFTLIHKGSFFELSGISRKWLHLAFFLKLLAALILVLIYSYYYSDRINSDIFKYYDDAKAFYDLMWDSPAKFWRAFTENVTSVQEVKYYDEHINYWERQNDDWIFNDNKTIISIILAFLFISFGFYAPLVIVFSFFAFVGIVGIYKFFATRMESQSKILFLILFFMPSILLWTSGMLKETILISMLGLFLYYLDNYKKSKTKAFCIIFLSVGILSLLKYYVILSLFPGILIYVWHRHYPEFVLRIKIAVVFISLIILVVLNHYVFHFYPLLDAIALKHNNFVEWVESLGNVGSYVKSGFVTPDFLSLLKLVPKALLNTLLRPLPWEISNVMMIIPALENIFLVALVIFMLLNRNRINKVDEFVVLNISFVLILFTLSGIVCPVIGALVRYKVPALPFLYGSIMYFTNYSRLHFISFLKP